MELQSAPLHPADPADRADSQLLAGACYDDRWLDALPRPVVALDPRGCVLGSNTAAGQLLGIAEAELLTGSFAERAVPEPHRGGFLEVLALVLTDRRWVGELTLRTEVGPQTVQAQMGPVHEASMVTGVILTVDAVGPGAERAALLGERLSRLAQVAAAMQTADDLAELTDIVVAHMADAAGATSASLSVVVEEHTLALVGLRGGAVDAAERWATYPVDGTTPAGRAVLDRTPLLLVDREQIEVDYPDLELAAEGERSLLCLPLTVADRSVGVATLSFPGRREVDATELEFYRVMADGCALALDRIQVTTTVAAQHRKLTMLAEATTELASSLDYESTLRRVAWLGVPDFADWCGISLEQDGRLRNLAVAHRDPAKIELAALLEADYPADPADSGGSYQVLSTGESLLYPDVSDELLAATARDERHLELLQELDLRSGMTVALAARGRTFGTITWVRGASQPRFGAADLAFGEDLARRAGVAIDNSLLHSELREVADRLQSAVAPSPLPELPGWELSACYSSAGRVDVGGDFYEVLPLPDGRLALAIGDVMGRGVEAAAAMAQVRGALRAFAAVDPDPVSVVTRLDLFYERFPTEQLVTLLYGLIDPATDRLSLVSAGHPPPLLVDVDGVGRYLDAAHGTLLGVEPAPRSASSVRFPAGGTLVMFTDGLIERRNEDLQDGQDRLRSSAARVDLSRGGAAVEQLTALMCDPTRDDDVAILVARRTPEVTCAVAPTAVR